MATIDITAGALRSRRTTTTSDSPPTGGGDDEGDRQRHPVRDAQRVTVTPRMAAANAPISPWAKLMTRFDR